MGTTGRQLLTVQQPPTREAAAAVEVRVRGEGEGLWVGGEHNNDVTMMSTYINMMSL